MPRGLAYYNEAPAKLVPVDAPKSQVKVEFARRLQAAMTELGLNQSELARLASKFLDRGHRIGRYSISCYVTGRTLPRPDYLNALASALNLKPKDLLPTRGVPRVEDATPPLDVKDVGDGKAHIHVNQTVSWEVALQIMNLLKGEK